MSSSTRRGQAVNEVVVSDPPTTFMVGKNVAKPEPDCVYSITASNAEDGIQVTGTEPELHHWLHRARTELSRKTGGPRIMNVIDLSTHHLPQPVCDRLNTYRGVSAHFTGWGWLLTVPGNLAQHIAEFSDTVPAQVWQLWQ
ncbi:hypothetical protein [Actinoplanes sp. NPDC020271]|uniref:hypothetical protein n=1 Tax=Actinoplanes sp. NPDC020271 TaxID=3363896 RepID=UPI0037909128